MRRSPFTQETDSREQSPGGGLCSLESDRRGHCGNANTNRLSGLCRVTGWIPTALRVHRRSDRSSNHRRNCQTSILRSSTRTRWTRGLSHRLASHAPGISDRAPHIT